MARVWPKNPWKKGWCCKPMVSMVSLRVLIPMKCVSNSCHCGEEGWNIIFSITFKRWTENVCPADTGDFTTILSEIGLCSLSMGLSPRGISKKTAMFMRKTFGMLVVEIYTSIAVRKMLPGQRKRMDFWWCSAAGFEFHARTHCRAQCNAREESQWAIPANIHGKFFPYAKRMDKPNCN